MGDEARWAWRLEAVRLREIAAGVGGALEPDDGVALRVVDDEMRAIPIARGHVIYRSRQPAVGDGHPGADDVSADRLSERQGQGAGHVPCCLEHDAWPVIRA